MKYTILNFLTALILLHSSASFSNDQDSNQDDKTIVKKYFDCPCPHLIAHRGASGIYPDSSLLAFEKALELNTDILELDVHLSKDKRIIVNHDSSLLRTTGIDWEIQDKTLKEILSTDAGFTFQTNAGEHPFRGKEIKLITLSQLVNTYPNARFNVEIKPNNITLASKLNQFIAKRKLQNRIVVASKHAHALEYFREKSENTIITSSHLKDIAWAYIYWAFNMDMKDTSYGLLQLPYQFVNSSLVEYFHKQGKKVHVWTVNDPDAIREMLLVGVDGVMTDHPELAYPIFVELGLR